MFFHISTKLCVNLDILKQIWMNQGIIMEYPTNEILIHGECCEHITKT